MFEDILKYNYFMYNKLDLKEAKVMDINALGQRIAALAQLEDFK